MRRSLLLFSTILMLSCSTLRGFAQVPNPSFENWTAGTPDGWWTNNITAANWIPVTQSRTAHSGTYAVRGDVIALPTGAFLSPQIVTGTAAGGFTVNQRYAALTGYYQFSPVSGDRLTVTAALYKGGAGGIGVAGAAGILTNAASSYTQFTIPFQYATSDVPDWCSVIVIIAAAPSGTRSAGSYFLIDDLALSGTATAVSDLSGPPRSFALEQNFPNPFNPSTNIRFSVAQPGHVSLKVYNVLGAEVATLVNEQKDAGTFIVNWNASGLPSGVYLCRMSAMSDKGQLFDESRRLVLLK